MLCTRCGWEFDEQIDCHCSGCGRLLRGLALTEEKQHHNLFFGGGAAPLSFEIENRGEHPIRIERPWELAGLESLSVTINRSTSPPVVLDGNERAAVEVNFDWSRLPFPQMGLLRIHAGIRPPLEVRVVCLPVPVFFFSVNGRRVNNGVVKIITPTPRQPELLFKIELGRCPDVAWNTFRLYPEGSPEGVFPLPAGLSFPVSLAEGAPFEFSLSPVLPPATGDATVLRVDFGFEDCAPHSFTIEIVESARIVPAQDFCLNKENVFVRGKSETREIEITLQNQGGVEVEILQVSSRDEPWLSLSSQPDKPSLLPYGRSEAKFKVLVDPNRMPDGAVETSAVNGELALAIRGTDKEQILPMAFELRSPVTLTFPVAIDFGNSSTCAAYIDGSEIRLIPLDVDFPEALEFPTMIDFESFTDEGSPETGEGFRYGHLLEITRYAPGEDGSSNFLHRVWSFKRRLGTQSGAITRIDRRNKKMKGFSAEEIYGFYLKEVLCRFGRITGCSARQAVLTYPASLGLTAVRRLRETAEGALGMPVITEISEPEALALHHFRRTSIDKPLVFAVFDFGGGTTDISIGRVRMEAGVRVVSMLISVGLEDLGGDTLSFRLARDIFHKVAKDFSGPERFFPEEFGDIFKITLAERKKLYNFMSIMRIAEELKTNRGGRLNELFASREVKLGLFEIYTPAGPERRSFTYTLDDFKRVVTSRIRSGFEKLLATYEHLREHGVISHDDKIDLLILGGNSSRLPTVRNLAAEVLNLPEEKILFDGRDAKTAVALGAACYGQVREDPDVDIVFENRPHLKYPLGRRDNKGRFEVIFPAGSEVGRKTVFCECNLRAPSPVLRLFWNRDPANADMESNSCIHPAAEFSLKKYKGQYHSGLKLKLKLVEDGVRITPAQNEEAELIPIEF